MSDTKPGFLKEYYNNKKPQFYFYLVLALSLIVGFTIEHKILNISIILLVLMTFMGLINFGLPIKRLGFKSRKSALGYFALSLVSIILIMNISGDFYDKERVAEQKNLRAEEIFNAVSNEDNEFLLSSYDESLIESGNHSLSLDKVNQIKDYIGSKGFKDAKRFQSFKRYLGSNNLFKAEEIQNDLQDTEYYAQTKTLIDEYHVRQKEIEKQKQIDLAAEKARKEELLRKREEELLEKVKSLPSENIKDNLDIYKQLSKISPDNKSYKSKVSHYQSKYDKLVAENEKLKRQLEAKEQKEKKRIAEAVKKFGKFPERNAWDGSFSAVKKYLKSNAHDPDSIEFENCIGPDIHEKGWAVLCKYRGANTFGAKILQEKFFIINNGFVFPLEK